MCRRCSYFHVAYINGSSLYYLDPCVSVCLNIKKSPVKVIDLIHVCSAIKTSGLVFKIWYEYDVFIFISSTLKYARRNAITQYIDTNTTPRNINMINTSWFSAGQFNPYSSKLFNWQLDDHNNNILSNGPHESSTNWMYKNNNKGKTHQKHVQMSWCPFYCYGLTFIPAWISISYIQKSCRMKLLINSQTSTVPATAGVWEWINNFIPLFMVAVITYPCWDWSQLMQVNWVPGINCM